MKKTALAITSLMATTTLNALANPMVDDTKQDLPHQASMVRKFLNELSTDEASESDTIKKYVLGNLTSEDEWGEGFVRGEWYR